MLTSLFFPQWALAWRQVSYWDAHNYPFPRTPSLVTSLTELTETRYRNSTERVIRLKGIPSFYRLNARYEFSAFTSLPESRSKKPKALLADFPSKLDLTQELDWLYSLTLRHTESIKHFTVRAERDGFEINCRSWTCLSLFTIKRLLALNARRLKALCTSVTNHNYSWIRL